MSVRLKVKKVCGIQCHSIDKIVWTWILDNHRYDWCKAGQVRYYDHRGGLVICWLKSLDAAVALTIGYHEAKGLAQRLNIDYNA